MASLTSKNGRWSLQFRLRPNQDRVTLALGAMSNGQADSFCERVEALVASLRADSPPDRSTAAWVANLPDDLHSKLAKAGLVIPRDQDEEAAVPTLEKFLAGYIAKRTDSKATTKAAWGHTKRCLVAFFGATRPIDRISAGEAVDFRRWLADDQNLGENTIRRRLGFSKQFFRAAVRYRLLTENPFAEVGSCMVRENRERDRFVTAQEATAVLEACPDAEWRLIFALSRFGGLRCPSEHLALRWGDVDWERSRMLVRASKTEHHANKGRRQVPIFPELRPYLEDAFELATHEAGGVVTPDLPVITRYRAGSHNFGTQMERIVRKAGLEPWPKLFQNLRATRATELVAAGWPEYKVCKWLGHTEAVAKRHYWQVTDDDYRKAAGLPEEGVTENQDRGVSGLPEQSAALQMALQQGGETRCKAVQPLRSSDSVSSDATPDFAPVCSVLHGFSAVGMAGLDSIPAVYA